MEVAERRPFPASFAAENGSEIANRNSLWVLSNAALKPSEQAIRINQKCAGRHSVEKERGIAYLLARRISYNFFHKLNSLTCEKFSDRITHFLLVGCKNTWLVQRRITIEQQLSCHATGSTN